MTLRGFALAAAFAAIGVTPALAQEAQPAPAQQPTQPNPEPNSPNAAQPAAPTTIPAPEAETPAPPATPAPSTASSPQPLPPDAEPPPPEQQETAVPLSAPTSHPVSEDTDAPDVVRPSGPSRVVVLSAHDEAAYRTAFEAIDRHNWAGVASALARVQDELLVATVRGRMLSTRGYRATFNQLNTWLAHNDELGVAPAVYQRALASRPMRGRRRHRHPVGPMPHAPEPVGHRLLPATPPDIQDDSVSARSQILRLTALVGSGDDAGALSLGQSLLDGPRSGQAAWELGLVEYRAHDYTDAVRYFEQAAAWPYNGGWASAAAHYWAARARLATGQTGGVHQHLEAAAQKPWTLYGQLAETQLGHDSALSFTQPTIDAEALRRFLDRHPTARRAAALAQLGRLSEVEAELRRLHGEIGSQDDTVYFSLAVALQAPAAQLRAAEFGGPSQAAGYCPATSFSPDNGFQLDRALIFAIVRQESYFNPKAVSATNARGLMQLLASTAHDMDRSTNYRRDPTSLFDPGHNLALGQAYVHWLMGWLPSGGDLGQLFASYNGGPGWMSRWVATQSDASDPLMILETMPRADSRDYAERVLSHMSLCRKALGQPTLELDALAAGRPAMYTPLDNRTASAAAAPTRAP